MLDINASLFVQIANFLILLFILNIILYRPIRKILGQRNDEEGSLKNLIDDFQGRFTQDEKNLQERIVETRKEGFGEKEKLKGQGLDEERKILESATSDAEGKIGSAKEEIQRETIAARKSLEDEINLFSQELVQKILGRSV